MREKVSPAIAWYVARRDAFRCIAPAVDGHAGWCRDKWGNPITRWPNYLDSTKATIAHVKDDDGQAMGERAPSDPDHLLILCWGHHEGNGMTGQGGAVWGTSRVNLEKQRRYLDQFKPNHPRTPRL